MALVGAYRKIYLQLGSRPLDRPRWPSALKVMIFCFFLGGGEGLFVMCRAGYDAARAREKRGGPPSGVI